MAHLKKTPTCDDTGKDLSAVFVHCHSSPNAFNIGLASLEKYVPHNTTFTYIFGPLFL